MSQTMLRIKDPEPSLRFYTEYMGMSLLAERHYPPEKGDFSLFFLCNSDALPDPKALADPKTPEAMEYIRSDLYSSGVPVLELTHNHGTEKDPAFMHRNGNEEDSRGFGHIGFLVPDVDAFCESLAGKGVSFHKLPQEGAIKGIAFAKDPDGYLIELIQTGWTL